MEIAVAALAIIGTLFSAAKQAGILGQPDWLKYADAGIYAAEKLAKMLGEMKLNPSKYDNMTPEQILKLLLPRDIGDLEMQAARELAEEGG